MMRYVSACCLLAFLSSSAMAHEVCKDALKKFDGVATKQLSDREAVLKSCEGSHGSNDAFLRKMMKRCERILGGKASAETVASCKVDAYRYISWGEYP